MRKLSLWLVILIATSVIPWAAWKAVEMVAWAAGVTRYVDTVAGACTGNYSIANRNCTGSDGNSYATIALGLAATTAGDTLAIRVGTYTTAIVNAIPAGVSASVPTIVKAYNGETVILAPGTGTHVLSVSGRANITIQDLRLDGTGLTGSGVKVDAGSHNFVFEGTAPGRCKISNTNGSGFNSQGVSNNGILRGCEITANGLPITTAPYAHGGYIQAGSGWIVERNVIHNNGCVGLQFYPSLTDSVMRRNIFHDNGRTAGCGSQVILANARHLFEYNWIYNDTEVGNTVGVWVQLNTPTDTKLRHNTFYNAGTDAIRLSSATNTIIENNLACGSTNWLNQLGSTTGTITTDNLTSCTAIDTFKSITTGAFDLSLKSGAVAIDGGTNISLPFQGVNPEQGATEVPLFSSCEVKNGEPTRVYFRFTNNVRPPMSPASAVSGVTFRKNAASNVVVSTARNSDNEYYAVITDSQISTDTVDISINPATTNLADSSLIGGTSNQPFISTITNQSCTNNLAGAPSHTFTQARYEHHDWRGLQASPTILPHGFASTGAAENFVNYKVPAGGKWRTRFAVTCGGGVNCPDSAFHPYVSTGGAYVRITDDFSSNNIKMCGLPMGDDMPANGSPTTNQLSTSGTFVAGGVVFTANDIPEVVGLNNGYKTELEYCFALDTDATENFDIRLYLQDGTSFTSGGGAYTVTPRMVATPPAAGGM